MISYISLEVYTIFRILSEMVLYNSEVGEVSVNAYIKDETIWVIQKTMAELFGGTPLL